MPVRTAQAGESEEIFFCSTRDFSLASIVSFLVSFVSTPARLRIRLRRQSLPIFSNSPPTGVPLPEHTKHIYSIVVRTDLFHLLQHNMVKRRDEKRAFGFIKLIYLTVYCLLVQLFGAVRGDRVDARPRTLVGS